MIFRMFLIACLFLGAAAMSAAADQVDQAEVVEESNWEKVKRSAAEAGRVTAEKSRHAASKTAEWAEKVGDSIADAYERAKEKVTE